MDLFCIKSYLVWTELNWTTYNVDDFQDAGRRLEGGDVDRCGTHDVVDDDADDNRVIAVAVVQLCGYNFRCFSWCFLFDVQM